MLPTSLSSRKGAPSVSFHVAPHQRVTCQDSETANGCHSYFTSSDGKRELPSGRVLSRPRSAPRQDQTSRGLPWWPKMQVRPASVSGTDCATACIYKSRKTRRGPTESFSANQERSLWTKFSSPSGPSVLKGLVVGSCWCKDSLNLVLCHTARCLSHSFRAHLPCLSCRRGTFHAR